MSVEGQFLIKTWLFKKKNGVTHMYAKRILTLLVGFWSSVSFNGCVTYSGDYLNSQDVEMEGNQTVLIKLSRVSMTWNVLERCALWFFYQCWQFSVIVICSRVLVCSWHPDALMYKSIVYEYTYSVFRLRICWLWNDTGPDR